MPEKDLSGHTFRVASYNANSVRARLPVIEDWLRRHQPDVLCLQETKVQDHEFPVEAFQKQGYQVVFRGEKSYNGVAIASREEPKNVAFGLEDENPSDEVRLVRAQVRGIPIVNAYVPQGRDAGLPQFQYKLEWFRRLRHYFERHFSPEQPVLLVGDLNVAPEPRDVYAPKELLGHVCFCPEVWQAFQDVMAWGFVDVFRKHCPEADVYTFYDYRIKNAMQRKMGWRIDHILATRSLAARSVTSYVDLDSRKVDKPSDHLVLVAEFHVAEA